MPGEVEEDNNKKPEEAAAPQERLSLWQWMRQNDITVLILVAVLTVVITRVATHVDEKVVQPTTHKILRVPPGEQPSGWKLAIEFFLVLAAIYVIVEYIIRPAAPISHYILPPAVVDVKTTQNEAKSKSHIEKAVNWEDTFKPPPTTTTKTATSTLTTAAHEWW